jgi:hypothetical protein
MAFIGVLLFPGVGPAQAKPKHGTTLAVAYAISQPYPYNALAFDGVYQGNLFSNLSLEYFIFPNWALTAAMGNDVLKWDKDQWIVDPVSQTAVTNVYLDTWHYMGGVKFLPWGEFDLEDFWKVSPYFTLEGGALDFQAVRFADTVKGTSTGLAYYYTIVPMVGGGLGVEFGLPGEDEESEILTFFSRHVRFFAGVKYFVGFTPSTLQYIPLQFGLKLKFDGINL